MINYSNISFSSTNYEIADIGVKIAANEPENSFIPFSRGPSGH